MERKVTWDGKKTPRWLLNLPPETTAVEVIGPETRRLLVSVRTVYLEDGARARPLVKPLRITRRFCRLVPGRSAQAGAFRRIAFLPRVAAGDLLEVELALEAPPELSYLVLECPIPAGFEVVRQRGLVIHDDRVTLGVPGLPEDGRLVRRFRMIPARRGQVAWPPAHVQAMYEPELGGRTRGSEVTIAAPRPPSGGGGRATVFTADQVREARRALESEVALDRLQAFPDRRVQDWLLEVAPKRLGRRLSSDRKLRENYLRSLGDRIWERLQGDALDGLVAHMGGSTRKALDQLALSLVEIDLGAEAAGRYAALPPETTGSTERLLALASIYHRRLPGDAWARLALAERILLAPAWQGRPGCDEVVAERRAVVLLEPGPSPRSRYHEYPFARLVTEPFVRACASLWKLRITEVGERQSINLGNFSSPEKAGILCAFLDRVIRAGVARYCGPTARLYGAQLGEILDQADWSGPGSAEPEDHARLREALCRLHATLVKVARPGWLELADRDFANTTTLFDLFVHPAVTTAEERASIAYELLGALLDEHERDGGHERLLAAEHVLAAFSRISPEGRALRPLAWRAFRSAASRLHDGGWALLSPADRAAVPTAVLLARLGKAYRKPWIMRALVERGVDAQARMLAWARRFGHDSGVSEYLVTSCADEALQTLPLDDFLALLVRIEPWHTDYSGLVRRLIRILVTGPWKNEELTRRLGRSGDVRARTALLRACAARGIEPSGWSASVPAAPAAGRYRRLCQGPGGLIEPSGWDESDPATERYRTLLAARAGHKDAAARVRRWLRGSRMPEREHLLLVWALGPNARIQDVRPLGTGSKAEPYWREVLARAPLTEIRALWTPVKKKWTRSHIRRAMAYLPAGVAARLAPDAFMAWHDHGKPTLSVLLRAPAAAVLPPVLLGLDDLPVESLFTLLVTLADRPDLALPVAIRLTEHSEVTVRRRAALLRFRLTGEPVTFRGQDGRLDRAGPTRPSEALDALKTRVKRRGLEAVESALGERDPGEQAAAVEWLSRKGLYLGLR